MVTQWALFLSMAVSLTGSNITVIFGFQSKASCEYTRAQVVEKMSIRKDRAACVEIRSGAPTATQPVPPAGPPPADDQQH